MTELASLCPICQQRNTCAMASGQDISRCWCVDTAYHAVELVKQYVEAHPDKVIGSEQCVCAACLADIAQCSVAQSSAVDIFIP